jgi:pimeloyl-ACP methyl ester carboxylesterase
MSFEISGTHWIGQLQAGNTAAAPRRCWSHDSRKGVAMLHRFIFPLVSCIGLLSPAGLLAKEGFFDSKGVKIHYTDEGQGEPVLLIHGFTADIALNWRAPGIIKELAKNYRVIALDNRGHGKSDKPHDPKKYGAEMVEDAVRLLDHLKIQKAHVVGYSMGAIITAKLLVTHPDRLLSATLGGHGGLKEGEDLSYLEPLAKAFEEGKGAEAMLNFLAPKQKPTEAQVAVVKLLLGASDSKALAAVLRSFNEFKVPSAKLKANKLPILVLIGENDSLKKSVDELEGKTAKLEIVVLKGADHMTAMARPEFVKGLQEFLRKHASEAKSEKQGAAPGKK